MATSIIGITGLARAGKDTSANVLVKEFGYTRVSFADGVRSMALAIDPLLFGNVRLSSLVRTSGWEEAKTVPEVRRLLQVIGTEGVRDHIGDDSWVRAAKLKIDATLGPVVISDVRFPNEAQSVKSWGGYMIRVERFNEDGSPYDNGLGTEHPSECHVMTLQRDLVIQAHTVNQLEEQIRTAANSYIVRTNRMRREFQIS